MTNLSRITAPSNSKCMGKIDEAKLLRRRALDFLDNARYLLGRGVYDLSSFSAEQAVQLYLKSKLLEVVGDYPTTYSVINLLRLLMAAAKDLRLERFIDERWSELRRLEEAYLSSRYFYSSYEKRDAEDLVDIASELISILEGIGRVGRESEDD
ncbi:hypothetical protein HRbin01_00269 [archaeon HR01]|nr:hypothetical protein HRbin01_00269 [archaeon HR01]